ncbi:MAG: hypothetical protein PHQ27_07585 [Victivallales bacterium]|nr:hypothetical protein [Victivallales bacterium]
MNLSQLNIGILHSLVGKNDGVSIVIDQSVEAMVKSLNIPLGNIFFLAAHTSPRFNAETDEVFWHKNDINRKIVKYFSIDPPQHLETLIEKFAAYAEQRIERFIQTNHIDILIAHNTSHPYNFITAVGLGRYLEKRRGSGMAWPKVLVWWHDSYFERPAFSDPNELMQRYLKYLPGTEIDGIVFINREQQALAERYYQTFTLPKNNFFAHYTAVIPNTCDITWNWRGQDWNGAAPVVPPVDPYNHDFFRDIGLERLLRAKNHMVKNTILLLQHTRVVPRKKIETAIDLAFRLAAKSVPSRPVALIVSGPSGDEQTNYKNFLKRYYLQQCARQPQGVPEVFLCFAENRVLAYRDVIVDRKFYSFGEVPAIIAAHGGLGVFFSEIEGFGNNLLEMIGSGLPVVVNRYPVYREEIAPLGFQLPGIDHGRLTDQLVDDAWELLNEMPRRNAHIYHNMAVLDEKLNHRVMAEKLRTLFENLFFRV